jgi:lysophospholipase L1-like esterase
MLVSRSTCLVLVVFALISAAACGSGPAPQQPTPVPDAPQITCPADVSKTSPTDTPLTVVYQVPSAVGGSLPVSVSCAPASGTEFPLGTTGVKCTATDAISRAVTCGFTVKIAAAPKLEKTKFMAFGDSMTMGVVSLRRGVLLQIPSPVSYPGRLQALLAGRYTTQTTSMDDQGVQGEKTADGWRRFGGAFFASSPEVVLLMEGANDLNTSGTDAISGAEANIDSMITASLDGGAVPILAGLPPQRQGGFNVSHAEAVEPFNARMKAVAQYRGIPFVDLFAAFGGTASTDLIGSDGLHPTEAGYQRIAEAFFAAVKAKLEVTVASPTASNRLRK